MKNANRRIETKRDIRKRTQRKYFSREIFDEIILFDAQCNTINLNINVENCLRFFLSLKSINYTVQIPARSQFGWFVAECSREIHVLK